MQHVSRRRGSAHEACDIAQLLPPLEKFRFLLGKPAFIEKSVLGRNTGFAIAVGLLRLVVHGEAVQFWDWTRF